MSVATKTHLSHLAEFSFISKLDRTGKLNTYFTSLDSRSNLNTDFMTLTFIYITICQLPLIRKDKTHQSDIKEYG